MKAFFQQIKNSIPLISILLSLIVAWIMFPITTGFPLVAFAILFIGFSSLVYALKNEKSWVDSFLYFGVVSLALFTLYRANEFLQFFDFVFIIFFLSLLVRPLKVVQSLFHLLLSPVTVFFNTLSSANSFKYSFALPTRMNSNYLKTYIPTIVLTLAVLFITIPLLASANPLFNNVLHQTLSLLHVEGLWRVFVADSLAIYIIRIFVFICLAFMIPRALSVTTNGIKEARLVVEFPINYLIPKIALAGILIVFFITQLQLYFASPELLRVLGYTNSRLTNEVFAQVTLVAFIVLLLAYIDKSREKWNTRVSYFLLLEAFFLIGIAFKSVYDYSLLYGFTQKRLWGFASMTWLTGALGVYLYHFSKQSAVRSFMHQMIAFSVVVIFIINLLNFDYLIYHTAKPTTQAGIDYEYIASRSADAHYYTEVLPKLIHDIEVSKTPDQSKILAVRKIIRSIENLRYKYDQNRAFNDFNYAEYTEYIATKKMDILGFGNMLHDKEQKSKDQSVTPTPTP